LKHQNGDDKQIGIDQTFSVFLGLEDSRSQTRITGSVDTSVQPSAATKKDGTQEFSISGRPKSASLAGAVVPPAGHTNALVDGTELYSCENPPTSGAWRHAWGLLRSSR